jgi:hypothetical protein
MTEIAGQVMDAAMDAAHGWFRALMVGAVLGSIVGFGCAWAAAPEKPVAGKSVHFAAGSWSGVAEIGGDKKVRQCVLAAKRARGAAGEEIDTVFTLIIGRGSGFAVAISDDKLPAERILDDQAELTVGDRAFPATAFTVRADTLAIHPGDAAGVLTALEKATTLRLRSDGAGVASGAITLDLPSDALAWLKQCGKQFDIALDRPTDPKAGDIPSPRPRAPEIAPVASTAAGPAGIEDKQKISGWDASELRNNDGKVAVCFIRQHYQVGAGANARFIGTFLMVSRAKGLTMMLKDSSLNLPEGQPIEATLAIDEKPFTEFSAHGLGRDEIGIFPQHGLELARALGDGVPVTFDAPKLEKMEFPVPSGILPWLRACARRSGIGLEPDDMKP